MMKAVLITGATGKQGGAVVKSLLSRNATFEILAVTRNAQSSSAQSLLKKSPKIKLVEGNLDNPALIFQNAKKATSVPIWGVFSVQAAIGGDGHEEPQGKALIDASIKAGVKHFVYTSVDRGGEKSINTPTNVPHFITKHNIEHHLIEKTKNGEMDWTILRPVAFFENFTPDFLGKVFATAWKNTLKQKPLQLIAIDDIGFFAAEAFINSEKYKGTSISLAGDEITYDQMATIFKQKIGRDVPLTLGMVCSLLLKMSKEFGSMFRWFANEGYGANIAELKKIHPGLKDFGAWLEKDSKFVN
ncbi:nucleoside-diphosphate-sugar epimerase family protein [Xylogone sp. PMI_703]|nr:nucleoside-diphosphate-sugar epimerase family protein [Xylogone sp. PMI_703]